MDVPVSVSFNKEATKMAVSGRQFDQLNEVWYGKTGETLKQVTNMSGQIKDWKVPVSEVISWNSKDGAEIEGVLSKPKDFDPKKKYPLLLVIHGGPTGIDRPEPLPGSVYPISHWCEKGALVLRVNYRGSAGYGEKFRSLNFRNLGVGDMWDVMSGVDHLDKKGMIDTTRMGCMGWSQGGYISAFLTTNTNRFKAISVGAGISNWVTYYVNTDITPFTRQYLQTTPWADMNIYLKTSPMTNINKAATPTLIQHGEFDRRVPVPNAYELYRGLQDRSVPSKLIVYKGFGHGINKPKERLAAIWHNWQWFNHYVFGDKMEVLPVDE
jgi:dipeptidyl aminopeptidase/acylaminoacyl peptidase